MHLWDTGTQKEAPPEDRRASFFPSLQKQRCIWGQRLSADLYLFCNAHYLTNTESMIRTKTGAIGGKSLPITYLSLLKPGPYKQYYHYSTIREGPRGPSEMTDENMGLLVGEKGNKRENRGEGEWSDGAGGHSSILSLLMDVWGGGRGLAVSRRDGWKISSEEHVDSSDSRASRTQSVTARVDDAALKGRDVKWFRHIWAVSCKMYNYRACGVR